MATTSVFGKEVPVRKQAEVVETIMTLYIKSIGRVAEAQKKSLDLALLHNADLIGAWKKIAQVTPGTPVPTIVDLAANTFGQFVDLQKGAIDLAVEQTQTIAGLATERNDSVAKATDAVTAIVHDAVERAAVTHKNAIDFYAAQTKTVLDAFKKQSGVAGTPVEAATDSMQRGFNSIVETQKEMLNLASKRTSKANA